MVMKNKELSQKSSSFAMGGKAKMAGQQGANPAKPGTSSPASGGANNKFGLPNNVGKTGVMGKQGGAAMAEPGKVSTGGRSGDNTFKVSGGKNRMAGFTPAANAKPL
jgi:hypothetical protein